MAWASPAMWTEDIIIETDNSFDSSQLRPSPSTGSDVARRSYRSDQFTEQSATSSAPSYTSSSSSLSSSSFPISIASDSHWSINSTLLGLLDEEEIVYERPAVGQAPRTISTLLSTPRASYLHPTYPSLIPPKTRAVTPDGSIIVSISTPCGSGATDRSLSSTKVSRKHKKRRTASREITRKLDSLAKDIHRRDDARRQEYKETVDIIRNLQHQLRGLREFREERITAAPSIAVGATSEVVGSSNEITSLEYSGPGNHVETLGLAPASSSEITSVGSILAPFYSDGFSVEDAL